MNWTNNAELSFLQKKRFNTLEELKNSPDSSLLITITDQTMYDNYQKDDTVRIKLTDNIPEEADCLIYNGSTESFLFKHIKNNGDKFVLSQTFPEEKIDFTDNLELLGYATSILRV